MTDVSESNTTRYSELCYPVVPTFVLKEYSLNTLQVLKNEIEENLQFEYEISGIYPKENKIKIGIASNNLDASKQRIFSSQDAINATSKQIPVEIYSSDTFHVNQTIYGGDAFGLVTAGIGGTYKGKQAILLLLKKIIGKQAEL